MRNAVIVLILAALDGGTFLPLSELMAGFIPPNLPPGSPYQLVFVTAGTRDATSADIADYNDFVTAEAALNPLLPDATWRAVASTFTVSAHDNAPSGGLPVYNIAGELVAASNTGLYTAVLLTPIWYNQFGSPPGPKINFNYRVWTGMGPAPGTASLSFPMGPGGSVQGSAIYGNASNAAGSWDDADFAPQTLLLPLYALSDPITVVSIPEPSSFLLAALGLISLATWRWRKNRER